MKKQKGGEGGEISAIVAEKAVSMFNLSVDTDIGGGHSDRYCRNAMMEITKAAIESRMAILENHITKVKFLNH